MTKTESIHTKKYSDGVGGIWKGQYNDDPHSFLLENKKYFVPRDIKLDRNIEINEQEWRVPLEVQQTPLTSTPWSFKCYEGDDIYIHFYLPKKDLVPDLIGKISTYMFGSKKEELGYSGDFWFDDSSLCRLLLLKT